jgi:hypothetical protein
MISSPRSSYSGPTQRGQRHGVGALQFTGYFTYEGEFFQGRRQGKGKLLFGDNGKDGYIEGTFVDGELVGPARRFWPDGRIFQGTLIDGEMSGDGELRDASKVCNLFNLLAVVIAVLCCFCCFIVKRQ